MEASISEGGGPLAVEGVATASANVKSPSLLIPVGAPGGSFGETVRSFQ